MTGMAMKMIQRTRRSNDMTNAEIDQIANYARASLMLNADYKPDEAGDARARRAVVRTVFERANEIGYTYRPNQSAATNEDSTC